MKTAIFKTLLIISISVLLVACDKLSTNKKGDEYLWLTGHASYPDGNPKWGQSTVEPTGYFVNCYLDAVDGELTTEQQQYIKTVTWDIDTDEQAVDALIKKAKNYRHE